MKRNQHRFRLNDSSPVLSNLRVMLQECESRYRVSRATGVPEMWISKFVNGKSRLVNAENVETLLRYFGLEAEQMSELLSDPEKV